MRKLVLALLFFMFGLNSFVFAFDRYFDTTGVTAFKSGSNYYNSKSGLFPGFGVLGHPYTRIGHAFQFNVTENMHIDTLIFDVKIDDYFQVGNPDNLAGIDSLLYNWKFYSGTTTDYLSNPIPDTGSAFFQYLEWPLAGDMPAGGSTFTNDYRSLGGPYNLDLTPGKYWLAMEMYKSEDTSPGVVSDIHYSDGSVTPEPSTYLLFLLGIVFATLVKFRRFLLRSV